jgi:hypothetical protein
MQSARRISYRRAQSFTKASEPYQSLSSAPESESLDLALGSSPALELLLQFSEQIFVLVHCVSFRTRVDEC